jgi:hypothetical protein
MFVQAFYLLSAFGDYFYKEMEAIKRSIPKPAINAYALIDSGI